MEKWNGKIALVTGASFGLGNHLCKLLCKAGMIVVGIARSVDSINETAKELENEPGKIIGIKCDLTVESDIENVFDYIENNLGGISVLVNMASEGAMDGLLENEPDWLRYMLEVSVMAPAILCNKSIKSMRKHNIDGHILNVGGTASYITSWFDSYHFYSVTKFILRAIGDGLRMEFRANNINIRVMSIGPGHIMTGAQDRNDLKFTNDDIKMGFGLLGQIYNFNLLSMPKKLNCDVTGDNIYHNNVLPALTMQDVNDYIIKALELPLNCEITDIIMKPTDRKNCIFETDFYKRS